MEESKQSYHVANQRRRGFPFEYCEVPRQGEKQRMISTLCGSVDIICENRGNSVENFVDKSLDSVWRLAIMIVRWDVPVIVYSGDDTLLVV